MRQVTFSAFGPVMIFDDDLLEPGRPGQIGFVAPDAVAAGGLVGQDIRVITMLLAHAMAALTGKGLVRIRCQVVQNVGVTFITRLLARKHGIARRNQIQRVSAIPAVFAEGRRDQKRTRDQIRSNDGERQQNQTQNLWWQPEAPHTGRDWFDRLLGGSPPPRRPRPQTSLIISSIHGRKPRAP